MTQVHRSKRLQQRQDRRGIATVEFAICAPIFFLVVLASFEFAWLQVIRHTADNAAYEAARHVAVPGASATEATNRTLELMNAVGANGVAVTITPTTITPDTAEVTVQVAIPMSQNSLTIGRFTGAQTLTSTSTMKTERGD